MSLKELLSSSKTKSSLTAYLAESLLAHFHNSATCSVIEAYDTKIKGRDFEEVHTHEEADTLISNQVLASATEHHCREICVSSPDTDVFVILINLVSHRLLATQTHLKFLTGKGRKYREIDIIKRVQVTGTRKYKGFIGLHTFSGADWGRKFAGITKTLGQMLTRPLMKMIKLYTVFRTLLQPLFLHSSTHGELLSQIDNYMSVVCLFFANQDHVTFQSCDGKCWGSRNLEGESPLPTRATILPHIKCVNYIVLHDKSYTSNCPVLPPIDKNRWLV